MKHMYLAASLAMVINNCIFFPVNADQTYQADNTRLNTRDRNNANPTPEYQPNDKHDIKSIARLRRAIMRTNGLSTNAQNIKIISEGNYIILRGPVDSESEKKTLDDLAYRCCGPNIKNQLEVR